jgi:hypothetical protein
MGLKSHKHTFFASELLSDSPATILNITATQLHFTHFKKPHKHVHATRQFLASIENENREEFKIVGFRPKGEDELIRANSDSYMSFIRP